MIRKYLLALPALIVIGACSPPTPVPIADLQRDRTLTETQIQTDGIGVAGVTWAPGISAETASSDLSGALARELKANAALSNVTPAGELRREMGETAYGALLARFATAGSLEQDDLASLKLNADAVRYYLFVRLEQNETSTHEEPSEQSNSDDGIDYYYTSRTVRALFVVYDGTTGAQVWHGRIADSITRSNSVPRQHEGAFFKGLLFAFLEDLVYGTFPDPPPFEPVATQVFADFAASFPTVPAQKGPALLGLGTHSVAPAQPPHGPASKIPLAVRIEVAPGVRNQVYTYESSLTGHARWLVPVGEEIEQYADGYLAGAFSAGDEVIIAIDLASFAVRSEQASCDVRFSVHSGEQVLFDKTYHGEGTTHPLKLILGGALVMEESLRESTDTAIGSVFRQFLEDARLRHQGWNSAGY